MVNANNDANRQLKKMASDSLGQNANYPLR